MYVPLNLACMRIHFVYVLLTYTVTWHLCSTGNALITVATGTLNEVTADRTGLVSAHAYAVLSIREIKVHLCKVYVCTCSCAVGVETEVLCQWPI